MRYRFFPLTALLVVCPMAAASAQFTVSLAFQLEPRSQLYSCWDLISATASNATCSSAMTGGSGWAATSASIASRSASVATTLTQSGSSNSMTGQSYAYASVYNSIVVAGASAAGDNLVFRYQTSQSSTFAGSNTGSLNNFLDLFMSGNTYAYGTQIQYADGRIDNSGYRSTTQPGGVDLTVDFDSFSGTYNYNFDLTVYSFMDGDQPQDASARATYDARLAGIDAVDANGNVYASAVFAEDGSATLDVTATPEPATLALMLPGLAGIAAVARRRSRTA